MNIEASTVEEYLSKVPEDRKEPVSRLRKTVAENLPEGFREEISYNMIGFVVPHDLYPKGYHVNPELPLPFINIASQKNHIALYHSGIYADKEISDWFVEEYKKVGSTKLDMGKSCIRFKNPKKIPFELIGELCKKISVDEWVELYESKVARK